MTGTAYRTQESRPRPRLGVRLAFVAGTLLLCVAAAELSLRAAAPWTWRAPRPIDKDARDLPVIHGIFAIARPNVRGQFHGRLYISNSDGIRGPEVAVAKGPDTFRVIASGDSFTNGQGCRYEETYPALLSARLNNGHDTRHYDVINLGLGGLNLHESVRRLVAIGLKYKPDLIIYGYTSNDIEGPYYRKSRKDGPTQWMTPSLFFNLIGNQWNYFGDLFWHRKGSYLWELDDNYFRNPQAWDYWKKDFENLSHIASENRICLVMFLHTALMGLHAFHPYRGYYDAVKGVAREHGVPVIDPFPYFVGRNPRDLWVSGLDSHPNPDGHALLAKALEEGLAKLPLLCWQGKLPDALASPEPKPLL